MIGYGARVIECEPTMEARAAALAAVLAETGATPLHPFDHDDVIAGQGTAALEMLEDVPDLDAIVAPIGGGGLVAGLALAATALRPGIRVFAAEPAGADDAARSKRAGKVLPPGPPATIADGLHDGPRRADLAGAARSRRGRGRGRRGGDRRGDAVGMGARQAARRAQRRRGARGGARGGFRARPGLARVGVVLSGGNVDLERLPWVAQ